MDVKIREGSVYFFLTYLQTWFFKGAVWGYRDLRFAASQLITSVKTREWKLRCERA